MQKVSQEIFSEVVFLAGGHYLLFHFTSQGANVFEWIFCFCA
jgi:hypothetical protein